MQDRWWLADRDLYTMAKLEEMEAAERPEPGEDRRCTPEKLLAFVQECLKAQGRHPSLAECKKRFGGLLGPLLDGWELKERGLWPEEDAHGHLGMDRPRDTRRPGPRPPGGAGERGPAAGAAGLAGEAEEGGGSV